MSPTFCPECRKPIDGRAATCAGCTLARPSGGWPLDPYVGRLIADKYRVEERLGAGGMASVVRAVQIHGGQELGRVVLKILHPEHLQTPSIRARFVNEARAAREVTSPNVVKVFDLGFDGEAPFLVMEHLEGETLAGTLAREHRLDTARALHIALQIATALQDCHDRGIVHRDLKPDNVLLQPHANGDFVKVIDFGIARVPSPGARATHTLVGTPRYMAPEQIRMQDVDGRADIYALGVVLFEMLSGEPPIRAATPAESIERNLDVPPRRLQALRPDLPRSLDDLLSRMLAKSPSSRPATMSAVATELRALTDPQSPGVTTPLPGRSAPRRPRRLRTLVGGAILAAVLAAMWWSASSQPAQPVAPDERPVAASSPTAQPVLPTTVLPPVAPDAAPADSKRPPAPVLQRRPRSRPPRAPTKSPTPPVQDFWTPVNE